MTEQVEQPNKFVARIPAVLYGRMKDEAKKREVSANALLLEALRKELDGEGPEQRNPVQNSAPQFPEKSGSENTVPLSIRTVGPGLRPDQPEGHHFRDSTGEWLPPKPSAAELAVKYGIKTLATIEEVEPRLLASDPAFAVYNADVAPVRPSRNWAKFMAELDQMEPSEATYEFAQATAGVKLPVGFAKMPKSRQIAWLTENA